MPRVNMDGFRQFHLALPETLYDVLLEVSRANHRTMTAEFIHALEQHCRRETARLKREDAENQA